MDYQTALFTECLITHITNIFTLTPTYFAGTSAFSTVYRKLLIHSTLVKRKRLDIRIYSDRKNNYFYSNVYIKQKFTALEERCYLQECIGCLQFFAKTLLQRKHKFYNYVICNIQCYMKQLRKVKRFKHFEHRINTHYQMQHVVFSFFCVDELHVHIMAGVNKFYKNLEAISKTQVSEQRQKVRS